MSGCKSEEPVVVTDVEAPRYIETKAQIRNGEESHTVKIQIALLPLKALRMEVSATLGVSVATILVTPSQIRLALHQTKEFIIGPVSEKTLYPVFKQNINPRVIWKMVHDQNPASATLKCELNEFAKPVSCTGADGSSLSYTYESPVTRRIDIKNNMFEMDWIFKDQTQMPAYQNETFVLKKPDSYKEIVIK